MVQLPEDWSTRRTYGYAIEEVWSYPYGGTALIRCKLGSVVALANALSLTYVQVLMTLEERYIHSIRL